MNRPKNIKYTVPDKKAVERIAKQGLARYINIINKLAKR